MGSIVVRQTEDGEAELVIVGGMVLDIHGTPSGPAHPRTTTPGKVHYMLGGVARNVAECMSKLGTKPFMISAVGQDMAGNMLLEPWRSAGLSTGGIRRHQGINTAVVCSIIDTNGEVAAGVASVDSIEKFLTPEWIQQFRCNISSSPVLMVDANLSPVALETCCKCFPPLLLQWLQNPMFQCGLNPCQLQNLEGLLQLSSILACPILEMSHFKFQRTAASYQRLFPPVTFASPNEAELIAMANSLCSRDVFPPIKMDVGGNKYSTEYLFQMLKPAIWVLLKKGIKIVAVTLGPEGVFLCSKGRPSFIRTSSRKAKHYSSSKELYKVVASTCPSSWYSDAAESAGSPQFFALHLPSLPASVVRLAGAGDCLVGGTLASISAGLDVIQSLAVGIAAAKAAVEVETNVPSTFNLATIAGDARSVYAAAKVLFHQSML